MCCPQNSPAFRVVLKLGLSRKCLTNSLIELHTLNCSACAKCLCQSFKHKARYKSISTIFREALMPSQPTKTLQETTAIERLENQIIDAKVNANIHRRSTHQNILLK